VRNQSGPVWRLAVEGLVVGLAVLAAAPAAGPAAAAHGGPIRLEIGGDGADRVTAVVSWKRDGHPVAETAELSMTAVSTDGRLYGPAGFVSSGEGRSFYVSQRPLPKGTWRVTATATKPGSARASATAISSDPVRAATGAPPARDEGGTGARGGPGLPLAVLGGALVLLLAGVAGWRWLARGRAAG
jgi:hypothetical protein